MYTKLCTGYNTGFLKSQELIIMLIKCVECKNEHVEYILLIINTKLCVCVVSLSLDSDFSNTLYFKQKFDSHFVH